MLMQDSCRLLRPQGTAESRFFLGPSGPPEEPPSPRVPGPNPPSRLVCKFFCLSCRCKVDANPGDAPAARRGSARGCSGPAYRAELYIQVQISCESSRLTPSLSSKGLVGSSSWEHKHGITSRCRKRQKSTAIEFPFQTAPLPEFTPDVRALNEDGAAQRRRPPRAASRLYFSASTARFISLRL